MSFPLNSGSQDLNGVRQENPVTLSEQGQNSGSANDGLQGEANNSPLDNLTGPKQGRNLDTKSKKISKYKGKEEYLKLVKNFVKSSLYAIFDCIELGQVTGEELLPEQKKLIAEITPEQKTTAKNIKSVLDRKEFAFLKPLMIKAVKQDNGKLFNNKIRNSRIRDDRTKEAIILNRMAIIYAIDNGRLPENFFTTKRSAINELNQTAYENYNGKADEIVALTEGIDKEVYKQKSDEIVALLEDETVEKWALGKKSRQIFKIEHRGGNFFSTQKSLMRQLISMLNSAKNIVFILIIQINLRKKLKKH